MVDDVDAVANLVHSYAELLDAGELAAAGRLFVDAALRMEGSERELRGAAAVERLLRDGMHLYDGIPGTKHVVTNLIVEVADDRTAATARSYYTAFQARPELALQPILAGRWHDRFTRDGDGWRFADRLIFTDLVGDLRFHIHGHADLS
jgi:ketosteroid isomerase-like protein